MKTKRSVLVILIAIISYGSHSQTLPNSTWEVYDTSWSFIAYFHFSTDKLSVSQDNFTYNDLSDYQANGSNISIVDLPGGFCPVTDTGKYTYSIITDTLKFTLVSELCGDREKTLTTFHFINVPDGIQTIKPVQNAILYPNPANEEIFIKTGNNKPGSEYFMTDPSGRLVLKGKLNTETTGVSIANLPSGLYFFNIIGDIKQTICLIKR